jgi:hypothetical protein
MRFAPLMGVLLTDAFHGSQMMQSLHTLFMILLCLNRGTSARDILRTAKMYDFAMFSMHKEI